MGKSSVAVSGSLDRLPEFTRSTLPLASSFQNHQVVIIEPNGARTVYFSDGANWASASALPAAQQAAIQAGNLNGAATPVATFNAAKTALRNPDTGADIAFGASLTQPQTDALAVAAALTPRVITVPATLKQVEESMDLSFVARARLASSGLTAFYKRPQLRRSFSPPSNTLGGLISACNAAASSTSNERVVRVNADIDLAGGYFALPPGVDVVSMNGSRIINGQLRIGSNAMVGLDFANNAYLSLSTTPSRRPTVVACRFSDVTSAAIGDYGTAHYKPMFALNEFIRCGYATYLQGCQGTRLLFNKCTYAKGTGNSFFFTGGDDALCEYNRVKGGVVGFKLVFDRRINRSFSRNIWRRNLVEDISEEGMSLDAYGNDASATPVIDRVLCTSVSSTVDNDPVCNILRTGLGGINPDEGQVLIVLTGAARGRTLRMTYCYGIDSTHQALRLASNAMTSDELAALVGAQIAIGYDVSQNAITDNDVLNAHLPIDIYGIGDETTIAGNRTTCDGLAGNAGIGRGIRVGSLTGITSSTALSPVGTCVLPVSRTYVYGNQCDGDILFKSQDFNGDPSAYTDALPHYIGANNKAPTVLNFSASSAPSASAITDASVYDSTRNFGRLANDVDNYSVAFNKSDTVSGSSTQSGNASQTDFSMVHAIGVSPASYTLVPGSAAAAAPHYVVVDGYSLTVKYLTAPPSGSGNLSWTFTATA